MDPHFPSTSWPVAFIYRLYTIKWSRDESACLARHWWTSLSAQAGYIRSSRRNWNVYPGDLEAQHAQDQLQQIVRAVTETWNKNSFNGPWIWPGVWPEVRCWVPHNEGCSMPGCNELSRKGMKYPWVRWGSRSLLSWDNSGNHPGWPAWPDSKIYRLQRSLCDHQESKVISLSCTLYVAADMVLSQLLIITVLPTLHWLTALRFWLCRRWCHK